MRSNIVWEAKVYKDDLKQTWKLGAVWSGLWVEWIIFLQLGFTPLLSTSISTVHLYLSICISLYLYHIYIILEAFWLQFVVQVAPGCSSEWIYEGNRWNMLAEMSPKLKHLEKVSVFVVEKCSTCGIKETRGLFIWRPLEAKSSETEDSIILTLTKVVRSTCKIISHTVFLASWQFLMKLNCSSFSWRPPEVPAGPLRAPGPHFKKTHRPGLQATLQMSRQCLTRKHINREHVYSRDTCCYTLSNSENNPAKSREKKWIKGEFH